MTAAEHVRDDPYECAHCHEAVAARWAGDPTAAVAALLGVDVATAQYLLALNHLFPEGTALRLPDGQHRSVLAAARHLAGMYSMTLESELLEGLLASPALVAEATDAAVDWRTTVRRLPVGDAPVLPHRAAS